MALPGHDLIQKFSRAAGVPAGVHLQIADRCNHACQHCYQVQGRKGELSLDELKPVIDDLAASGVVLLNISGGEATLRPDLLDVLRYARSRGFALRLFTNAYAVTPALARELRAVGLLGVDVSVYSDDPAQHDAVTRVPGSHGKTLAGIRAMLDAGLRVHLKAPTTALVPDAAERVTRLAEQLGIGIVTSLDITPMENGDLASRTMAADPDLLVAFGQLEPWSPSDDHAAEMRDGLAQATCGACRDGVTVLSNGDLRPCTDIVAPLGNLVEQRFLDLYERPGPRMLRALTWADIHGCRDCDLRPGCGRCHAHAASEGLDLLGPYPSGCSTSLARYRGAHPGLTLLDPAEGCEPGRSPSSGPFRVVSPGVLQAIPDVLTEADQQRREQFPWVRPSREFLEQMSHGEGPPKERRRLPLLPRPAPRQAARP